LLTAVRANYPSSLFLGDAREPLLGLNLGGGLMWTNFRVECLLNAFDVEGDRLGLPQLAVTLCLDWQPVGGL